VPLRQRQEVQEVLHEPGQVTDSRDTPPDHHLERDKLHGLIVIDRGYESALVAKRAKAPKCPKREQRRD